MDKKSEQRTGKHLFAAMAPESPDADSSNRRPAPALLTLDEVAARLHMSRKSVQRRIKSGVIRKAPIGGRLVRVSADELVRLAAGGLFQGEPEDPDRS